MIYYATFIFLFIIIALKAGTYIYHRIGASSWLSFAKKMKLYWSVSDNGNINVVWGLYRGLTFNLSYISPNYDLPEDIKTTRISICYPDEIPLDITIYKANLHDYIFGDYFSGYFLNTDAPDFDKNFMIRSSCLLPINTVLTPEFRKELLKIKHLMYLFVITNSGVALYKKGRILNISTLTRLTDFLYRIVQDISDRKDSILPVIEEHIALVNVEKKNEEEKICQSCGKAVPEGTQFCITCGKEV